MNECRTSGSRCRIVAAFLFAFVGASIFGILDFGFASRFSDVDLGAADRAWLLIIGLGRHLLPALALAVLAAAVLAAPSRQGLLDPRLLLGTLLFAAFFVHYNESLTEGARISTRWYAKYILYGTRLGGPVFAFVLMLVLRAEFERLWQRRMNPAVRALVGAACLAVAAAAAYANIRFHPGRYPDIHAQIAAAALGFAVLAAFCLLGARPFDLTTGRRPLLVFGLAAVILAAALVSPRCASFQRVRSAAATLTPGVAAQEWLVGRVFGLFEPRIELRTVSVDDLLRSLAELDKLDLSGRLDERLPDRKKLNVLLIAVDTLRFDRVGVNGYRTNPTTPNLDALAAESFVFSDFYTNYPTSNYAYASLLTGLYPGSTPLHGHRTYQRWEFPDDRVNYARLFSRAGVHALGSTAMGLEQRENLRYFGMLDDGFDVFNPDQPQGDIPGRWVTETFLTNVDRRPTERFFGFVHYMEPHDPYESWPEFDFGPDAASRYDSEIAKADDEIGRLIAGLKRRTLWDSTVVAIFADHGEAFGEHGTDKHDSSLFDEQIKVPLVVRVPGLQGRRIEAAASLVDLLPTLSRLVGIDDPVARQGQSLVPYMLGDDGLPERVVFCQKWFVRSSLALREIRCVVHGKTKLIETEREPNNDFQMFDLERDPRELRSVFGEPSHADRQAKLVALLQAKVRETFDRVGLKPDDAPKKALAREVEALAKDVEGGDPMAAYEALKSLCRCYLSRHDDIDLAVRDLPAELHERVRRAVFKRALESYPKSVRQIDQLLRVLPHSEHVAYYRRRMNDAAVPISERMDAVFALARLGDAEILPRLKEAAGNKDLAERFEVAMSLAALGDASLLAEFVPFLRSDSTWDTAPLLRALASTKHPYGLRTLLDRLSYSEIADFRTKSLIARYAAAVDSVESERICLLLAEEADSDLSEPAIEALLRRYGSKERLDRRRAEFRIELQGTVALNNGKIDLAEKILAPYVAANPAASPQAILELGRARLLRNDAVGARQAFLRLAELPGDEYGRTAARQTQFLDRTRWFYSAEELACSWTLIASPKITRRDRCYLVEVELKNESDVYWHGGDWTYALSVRSAVVDASGAPLAVDASGADIRRPEVMNYLPLEGVAPGETIRLTVVGRAPDGQWSGRIAVWLEQRAGGKKASAVLEIKRDYMSRGSIGVGREGSFESNESPVDRRLRRAASKLGCA